jgi:hypothetical protein
MELSFMVIVAWLCGVGVAAGIIKKRSKTPAKLAVKSSP